MTLLHFVSKNDAFGNPRRLWAHFDEAGHLLATFDEGYKGFQAVPIELREKAKSCYAIQVGVKTYHSLLKHGKHLKGFD